MTEKETALRYFVHGDLEHEFGDNLINHMILVTRIGIANTASHLNMQTVDLQTRVNHFIDTMKPRKKFLQDILTSRSANDSSCSSGFGLEYVTSIVDLIDIGQHSSIKDVAISNHLDESQVLTMVREYTQFMTFLEIKQKKYYLITLDYFFYFSLHLIIY